MINASNRNLNEKTKFIRERGYIPGVIYSSKLEKSIPIEVYKTDFKRLVESNNHKGNIKVNLDGNIYNCIITDVQIDGIKDYFLHIDFKLV